MLSRVHNSIILYAYFVLCACHVALYLDQYFVKSFLSIFVFKFAIFVSCFFFFLMCPWIFYEWQAQGPFFAQLFTLKCDSSEPASLSHNIVFCGCIIVSVTGNRYNFVAALRLYKYDADCELFYTILFRDMSEVTYHDQMKMVVIVI